MPIKAVIVDLSGTLIQNNQPVAGVQEMLTYLRELNLKVFIASNKQINNGDVKSLFKVSEDEILTPPNVGGIKGTGMFIAAVCYE
jgi:ribonucleotide monophosphatase NagD (HAD superfamily)